MKEKMLELLTGEITLSKKECWMIGTICTLFGVIVGLIAAPLTHGLMIGCGNGNNSGNSEKEKKEGRR